MAEIYERDFKGIWIPKEVWLDDRLNALDKIILAEIDSLDSSDKGCWASNKHIAEFCQCTERTVSATISKLIECGYIYVQNFDGRQRELKSRLSNFERQTLKNCKANTKNSQGRVEKISMQGRKNFYADTKNLQESNTYNNTLNNTTKERKKESSYDEILSSVENDDLRELYLEYIKMRKMIKAPMTDRALTMLINKVNELEPHSVDNQKKMLEIAIMNNWKSVYPLRDTEKSDNVQGKQLSTQTEELLKLFGG